MGDYQMRKKREVFILAMGVLLFCWGSASAVPVDVNICSSTTIDVNNIYNTVNVYDTPPDQTTVTMTGGEVDSFFCHDTSQLLFKNGTASFIGGSENATIEMTGGSVGSIDLLDLSIMHWSGGSIESYAGIHDAAVLHVYGYGFNYAQGGPWGLGYLSGYFADDSDFTVLFRGLPESFPPQSSVVLHIVPEPCTFVLFSLGVFIVRGRMKIFRG